MKKKMIVLVITLAIGFILNGCAGKNFIKPEKESLILNKTTYLNIIDRFGEPYAKVSNLSNGKMTKALIYAYSSAGGEPISDGIMPARAIEFHFYNDILVGHNFVSSFKKDHTDFDESKIKQIILKKTTLDELIIFLGKPNGQFIFPIAKSSEAKVIKYEYTHLKGFNLYKKTLTVTIENNIVSDIDFTTSGEK